MTTSSLSEQLESLSMDLDSSSSSRMTELLFEIESSLSTPPNDGQFGMDPSKKTKLFPTDIFSDSFNSLEVSMTLFECSKTLLEWSKTLGGCSKSFEAPPSLIWKSFSKIFRFSVEFFFEVFSFSAFFDGDGFACW